MLADKKLGLNELVLSKPYVQVGATLFWEWNHLGWGPLDIKDGFAHSADTVFYQLAQRLGIDRLGYWGTQYGFGQPTGIDLPGRIGRPRAHEPVEAGHPRRADLSG